MAKVLVLYYSSYGHIETMAKAMAEGAAAAGAQAGRQGRDPGAAGFARRRRHAAAHRPRSPRPGHGPPRACRDAANT